MKDQNMLSVSTTPSNTSSFSVQDTAKLIKNFTPLSHGCIQEAKERYALAYEESNVVPQA